MAKSTSSRPVLALEDLEEVDDGLSLDELMAESDEPITSPFAPKTETKKTEFEEILEEDPFTPETSLDDLDSLMEVEPPPEPVVEPTPPVGVEKPKRTRRTKAELEALTGIKAASSVIAEEKEKKAEDDAISLDDGLSVEPVAEEVTSLDDLDSVDSMPEPIPTKSGRDTGTPMVASPMAATDPFEALIESVGDSPEWLTIVGYGKNGTGKTTFGASGDKTLVAEVEKDGTFSVRDRGSKAKKFKVKTWDDFEKLYWYLHRNPGKYNILCIDTLTRLQELCLRSVVLNKKAEGAELLDKDVVKITLPQRGDIGQRMIFWLNAYAELPLHKVWLCQEASGTDDKDVANVEVYPDLQRKIRVYVCSDATVIGRTEIKFKDEIVGGVVKEIPQFIMRTSPSESYLSKDRTKVLGAGLVNPKIDKLIEKVYA